MNQQIDLTGIIQRAIKDEIAKITELEIEALQKSIADKVRSRIGAIAATVSQKMDFRTMGNELTITVQFEKPSTPPLR